MIYPQDIFTRYIHKTVDVKNINSEEMRMTIPSTILGIHKQELERNMDKRKQLAHLK